MKLKLSLGILILAAIMFLNFSSAIPSVSDIMLGTWEYEAVMAPYEYQKGEMTVEKVEEELTIEFKAGGYNFEAESIKADGNNLKFKVYIEGTSVTFDLDFEEASFKGEVTYTEGTIGISGKKKE